MFARAICALISVWMASFIVPLELQAQSPSIRNIVRGFEDPVALVHAPNDASRIYVVERGGSIRSIVNGKTDRRELLEIAELLAPNDNPALSGLAFPNNYQQSKIFYVSYVDKQGDTVIARFPAKDDETANADDMTVILKIANPIPNPTRSFITFGADGYLYIAVGASKASHGGGADGHGSRSLFGKVLRIDVSQPNSYRVPSDNPFIKNPDQAPEVWIVDMNDPRHLSFDQCEKRLLVINAVEQSYRATFIDANTKESLFSLTPASTPTQADSSPYFGVLHPTCTAEYLVSDPGSNILMSFSRSKEGWISKPVLQANAPIQAIAQDASGEIFFATRIGEINAFRR